VIQKYTSLNYEPSLELLLITAKQLFLNRALCRSVQLSEFEQEVPVQRLLLLIVCGFSGHLGDLAAHFLVKLLILLSLITLKPRVE